MTNDSIRNYRENFILAISEHLNRAISIAGEVICGSADQDSIRPELLEQLAMGLLYARNLRELEEREGNIGEGRGPAQSDLSPEDITAFISTTLGNAETILTHLPTSPTVPGSANLVNQCAVEIFSTCRLMMPEDVRPADFDVSDNESAPSAPEGEVH